VNRLSSVIAGAITTAISGATLAAAAVSQGVFDGGPEKPSNQGEAVNAVAAQQVWSTEPTAEAQAAAEQPAPRVVYVDREPVIVTREIRTVAQSAGTETATAAPAAATSAATPTKTEAPKAVPPSAGRGEGAGMSSPPSPPPPPAATPESVKTVSAPPPTQAAAAAPATPPRTAPPAPSSGGHESEGEHEHENEHEHEGGK
jgi:hypothetical protein